VEKESSGIFKEQLHQLNLLKELRQQILKDAVQGKLVPQYPSDEPASKLFDRVKAEKEQLFRDNKIKKEKQISQIFPAEMSFKIPKNWIWCRLENLIIQKPQNGFSPVESKIGKGIKCLTLTSTTSGEFKSEFFKYVDVDIPNDSYLWLKSKDILIQRGNSIDYVGIAATYYGKSNEFIYPDLMIKIRLSDSLSTDYIHMTLISPYLRKYFQENSFGAQKSMPKINQEVVLKTPIPLPPIDEQQRIYTKIIHLFKLCDEIEQSIRQNQKYATELLQVALKEALNNGKSN
jgi:type I restriction enzyme S subunit